jgi:5,6-dimethylbenzimidazole synthase
LASRAEGIGVGWVSILSNEELEKTLNLPAHVVPIAYLCLGYVTEFAEKPDLEIKGWLSRLKLDDVVYYEKWEEKKNTNWKKIQELIKENLEYA